MINKKRVLEEFYELVKINCPSYNEREVADLLTRRLQDLGGTVVEDHAAAKALGGNTGNLVASFKGTKAGVPTLLMAAHMDCV